MFQGGSLWAGLASGAMSQVQDTRSLTQGNLSRNEYAVKTAANVTGAVGVMAGVEYGAMLGTSVLPGIGTAAGAVIGGLLGDRIGRVVGQQTANTIYSSQVLRSPLKPELSAEQECH